jgi:hypothetical protein
MEERGTGKEERVKGVKGERVKGKGEKRGKRGFAQKMALSVRKADE